MIARSGAGCAQATTASNELRFKQCFSKVTNGWIVKKISEAKNKTYIKGLVKEVVKYLQQGGKIYSEPDISIIFL